MQAEIRADWIIALIEDENKHFDGLQELYAICCKHYGDIEFLERDISESGVEIVGSRAMRCWMLFKDGSPCYDFRTTIFSRVGISEEEMTTLYRLVRHEDVSKQTLANWIAENLSSDLVEELEKVDATELDCELQRILAKYRRERVSTK
jgi:hypothetical protein